VVDVDVRLVGSIWVCTSTETGLVTALHAWFDRQSTDHAMPGMGG